MVYRPPIRVMLSISFSSVCRSLAPPENNSKKLKNQGKVFDTWHALCIMQLQCQESASKLRAKTQHAMFVPTTPCNFSAKPALQTSCQCPASKIHANILQAKFVPTAPCKSRANAALQSSCQAGTANSVPSAPCKFRARPATQVRLNLPRWVRYRKG